VFRGLGEVYYTKARKSCCIAIGVGAGGDIVISFRNYVNIVYARYQSYI
jgi:hypothetical protein